MNEYTLASQAIIDNLKAGNQRFLNGHSIKCTHASLKKLKDLAQSGQFPKAVVLCCSDSRAPAEMIFDQDIGDLFVIRVAGNIIAPSLVGSVEFAVSTFHTSVILVMGHSQCGAVQATLDHVEKSHDLASESIHDIISRIKPHVFPITKLTDLTHHEKMDRAVEANVVASVGQLSHSSRLIEQLVHDKKIMIMGAVLNLATGAVHFLES